MADFEDAMAQCTVAPQACRGARLAEQDLKMTDVDLAEMDRFWDEAKVLEKGETRRG